MFVFENPSDADADWFLGDINRNLGRISKKQLRCISNYHLLGIQFLFENFVKKRDGAILNQDEDMNMPLQVTTFLNSVRNYISTELPVVIVSPEHYICKWHFHLNECGFKPHIISSKEFGSYEVYLLSFESFKLIEDLVKLDLFCVVIDELDSVATKLIVRKIKGKFNIGLTQRNFYINPDQKLRWLMLNWSNPGCVGKLNDFYSIDRLHSLAFADNYRFWWMRLTWNFCDSFERPTDEDLQDYQQKLKSWGEIHQIKYDISFKEVKLKRKFSNTTVRKKGKFVVNNVGSNNSLDIPAASSKTSFHFYSTKTSDDEEINSSNLSEKMESKDLSAPLVPVEETVFSQKPCVENCSEIRSDGAIQLNEKPKSDDILDMFVPSKKTKIENISHSDDEDPIISIINSQNHQELGEKTYHLLDIETLSQSSESDSEFLSNIVKNKDKSIRSYRSQQISVALGNLSDLEENVSSDDESFFSELISSKKVKTKKNLAES